MTRASSKQPSVTIIVLSWNQRGLTLDCLESLARVNDPGKRLRTIVVDNASTDGTVDAIRLKFPGVTVLENSENLGFAEGNNVGIRHALESDTDYIFLLNNDTIVDPRLFANLLDVMEADASVGIAGPKMLYYDQPDTIWCAGNRINWRTGGSIRLLADQPDDSQDVQPQEMDFITACGICLRRQVIEQIGLLERRFFIYYEESDWCTRARRAGWRILYVPQARLWHRVSSTMGTVSPSTDYYMTRNVFLFLARNLGGWPRVRSLAYAWFRNWLTILAYTVKPHGGQRLPLRNARLLALRDAVWGRWGKMGPDVAAICYGKQ